MGITELQGFCDKINIWTHAREVARPVYLRRWPYLQWQVHLDSNETGVFQALEQEK